MIGTARDGWVMWSIGLGLGIAVIPLISYSGDLYYAEGGTSPDAPAMLLMAVLAMSPVWLGIWMAFIGLFLFRYPGRASLRPVFARSILGNALAVAAFAGSAFFLWLALTGVDYWKVSRLPFTLHFVGCAVYLQFLRAAAVHRSMRGKSVSDD
jgi:hypothetical protein